MRGRAGGRNGSLGEPESGAGARVASVSAPAAAPGLTGHGARAAPYSRAVTQVLALAMCVVTAEAYAPSFMGQGLNLRQAKASSALSMKIELAPLPYDYTALEPKIGKQTLEVSRAKRLNVARGTERTEGFVSLARQIARGSTSAGERIPSRRPPIVLLVTCAFLRSTTTSTTPST